MSLAQVQVAAVPGFLSPSKLAGSLEEWERFKRAQEVVTCEEVAPMYHEHPHAGEGRKKKKHTHTHKKKANSKI